MVVYRGFATMYMRTCMSTSFLPVEGKSKVDGCCVQLDFRFTGMEFELPCPPKEDMKGYDFKVLGSTGFMTLTLEWHNDLKCFTGVGVLDKEKHQIVTFNFFTDESPMRLLPNSPFPK